MCPFSQTPRRRQRSGTAALPDPSCREERAQLDFSKYMSYGDYL